MHTDNRNPAIEITILKRSHGGLDYFKVHLVSPIEFESEVKTHIIENPFIEGNNTLLQVRLNWSNPARQAISLRQCGKAVLPAPLTRKPANHL